MGHPVGNNYYSDMGNGTPCTYVPDSRSKSNVRKATESLRNPLEIFLNRYMNYGINM